jgi:hypothetical protein
MKILQQTLFIIILGLFIFSSYATATAYVGGGINRTDYKDFGSSKHDNGYTLFAGYKMARIFALEGGYRNFINSSSSSDLDVDAWLVSGTVSLPITIFDIYARGGYAFFDTNLNNDTEFYYGVGTGVKLGPVRVALEYNQFDTKLVKSTYLLSAEFHF